MQTQSLLNDNYTPAGKHSSTSSSVKKVFAFIGVATAALVGSAYLNQGRVSSPNHGMVLPGTSYASEVEYGLAKINGTFEGNTATQSSDWNVNTTAIKAVDGNYYTNQKAKNSCAQTGLDSNPWWRLELKDLTQI